MSSGDTYFTQKISYKVDNKFVLFVALMVIVALSSQCRESPDDMSSLDAGINSKGLIIAGFNPNNGCYPKLAKIARCSTNIGLVACSADVLKAESDCASALYDADPFGSLDCSTSPPYLFQTASCGAGAPKRLPVVPCPTDDYAKKRKGIEELAVSNYSVGLIKGVENFSAKLYNDDSEGQHCTIGYGHIVHRGPCDGENASEAPFKDGISDSQASLFAAMDLKHTEGAVKKFIVRAQLKDEKILLTQGEYDSLVSMVYNSGAKRAWMIEAFAQRNEDYWHAWNERTRKVLSFGGDTYLRGLEQRRLGEMMMRNGICPEKFNP